MGNSITSANSSINLVIPGVCSSGVLLENFSTDDMLEADPQQLTSSYVGVDWEVINDYVLAVSKFRMMFQANSSSIPVFYWWKAAQDAQAKKRDQVPVITGTMKIIVPSLGLDVDLTDVCCESLPFLPPLKRVAEALTVSMTCNPGWQTTAT